MRIYRVFVDVNAYQTFRIDSAKWTGDFLSAVTLDGSRRLSQWSSPPVYLDDPRMKRGSFSAFELGCNLVVGEASVEPIRDLLELSGELLPLQNGKQTVYAVNVTECVNCLDEEKTKWIIGKSTGARIGIEKYAFFAERLSESPVFKIPETSKSEILTVEGMKDPEDEFKPRVESLGLDGLKFELIWTGG